MLHLCKKTLIILKEEWKLTEAKQKESILQNMVAIHIRETHAHTYRAPTKLLCTYKMTTAVDINMLS